MKAPALPTFALVGQPNEGKTTIMSTLAEDDQARVSSDPGTTKESRRYPLTIDGETILVFWDTPGFERPAEVLAWMEANARDEENAPQRFIEAHAGDPRFAAESELFRPLAEGAAALYVVDASRPVREVDRQEMEILRLCGVPRIGLINSKDTEAEFLDEWKRAIGRDFNHRHYFNGWHASFRDRIDLLHAVSAIIPEWKDAIENATEALESDWRGRQESVADLIIRLLEDVVQLKRHETLRHGSDRDRAARAAQKKLEEAVRQRETVCRDAIRRTYRHSNEHWRAPEILEMDVFSREVWKVLGLSKAQLAAVGAALGATAGLAADALTLGASLMVAAAAGGVVGGAAAWWGAERFARITLPPMKLGPLEIGNKLGGAQAEAGVNPKSNLLWVLLDRALLYAAAAGRRAHGRRTEVEDLAFETDEDNGLCARNWSREEKALFTRLIGQCASKLPQLGQREETEAAFRALLVEKLTVASQ